MQRNRSARRRGIPRFNLVPICSERFGCEIDAVDIDFQKLELVDSRVKRIRARIEHPVWRTKSLLAARASSH